MTPPGPHAMTAQAGAVAWQVRHLDRANWWMGWAQVESEEAAKHMVGRYESLGQKAEYRALYATPPAAVPVAALEGLVDNWKRFSEAQGGADPVADDQRPGLAIAADELTQLIKERSNG